MYKFRKGKKERVSAFSNHSSALNLQSSGGDFVNVNSTTSGSLYEPSISHFSKLSYDLHPPLHRKSGSQATLLRNQVVDRSESSQSRPISQRSSDLVKGKVKKMNVEDMLAMRRLEQRIYEYPDGQQGPSRENNDQTRPAYDIWRQDMC
jgi:hypothetical protein